MYRFLFFLTAAVALSAYYLYRDPSVPLVDYQGMSSSIIVVTGANKGKLRRADSVAGHQADGHHIVSM